VAAGLADRGVRTGDRVVVVGDLVTWADLVVGVTAVHKVGAVAVPFAPSFGSFELARLAATCQAVAVLTSEVDPMAGAVPWVASPAELKQKAQLGPGAAANGPLRHPFLRLRAADPAPTGWGA
jgi:acyl-CoA synthetase (AMP-forming)/AMP-acid ligase II